MAVFTLTNARGKGPRGVHKASGGVKLIARGETVTVDLAEGEEAGLEAYFDVQPADEAAAPEPCPLDLNLDDLEAHLATMTDPDAVQALLDAEIAGKSRKGAVAALEARRDELLAAD